MLMNPTLLSIIQIILCLGLLGATIEFIIGFQLNHWYTQKILNLQIEHLDEDDRFKAALHNDRFVKAANVEFKGFYYFIHLWYGLKIVISGGLFGYLIFHNVPNAYLLAVIVIIFAIYDWYHSTKPIKDHKKIPNYYEDQFKKDQHYISHDE